MSAFNWLLQISRANPAAVALLGAHFVIYSVVAWIVLGTRFFAAKMKDRELILLETWLGLIVLELVQMAYHRGDFINGETWGIPRYFGVFAPLLWIWLAWLCAKLWNFKALRGFKGGRGCSPSFGWTIRVALVAALGWVFYSCEYKEIKGAYDGLVRRDVASAAEQVRRYIKADYAGPKKQEAFKRTPSEYFNDTRPVVFSDFGYAAWLLRTQSEGAVTGSGACPYPDDYLFLRMGSGYGGKKSIDSKVYDYVVDFRTPVGCTWRLFRRKGVPHNTVQREAPSSQKKTHEINLLRQSLYSR